jgi:hypothetical protein
MEFMKNALVRTLEGDTLLEAMELIDVGVEKIDILSYEHENRQNMEQWAGVDDSVDQMTQSLEAVAK